MSGVKRTYEEEASNYPVYCGGLMRDTRDGGSVVRPGAWRVHECFGECRKENGLAENEGDKIKVGVSDMALKVGRQDQVGDDIWRHGVTPHQVAAGPG